jgi:transcription elongation GreA/GreB family factor
VVDPEAPRAGQAATRAFFGATVRYANAAGAERVVSIVGTAEVGLRGQTGRSPSNINESAKGATQPSPDRVAVEV